MAKKRRARAHKATRKIRRKRRARPVAAPKRRKRRKARKIGTRAHARNARKIRARRRRASGRSNPARRRRRNPYTRSGGYVSPTLSAYERALAAKRGGAAPKRRKRRKGRKARKGGARRRGRRGGRVTTQRSILRARRTIRNRRRTPLAAATARRFRMRSNPASGIIGMLMELLPIVGTLYGTRALSYKFAGKIPGMSAVPAQFRGPVVAGALLGATHFATKKVSFLKKHRAGMMIGAGINFFDAVLGAFAPANVKAMFGLGDIYDGALGDYVQMGEYAEMGATPIDDDITMGDYLQVDGVSEELGLEEDLGLEQELGAADGLSRAYLGGTSQSSLLKRIPSRGLLAQIPDRSFSKTIGRAGASYDNADDLYTGIFAE